MFARSDMSDCIKLASQWLATCVFHLSKCARNVGSPLPTRVVDVKNQTSAIDPLHLRHEPGVRTLCRPQSLLGQTTAAEDYQS
jgi:hypothetical protein